MKTVDKALRVLDQFSLTQTEIGLSDLARMADLDKAATRRLLVALMNHGFVEQCAETKRYRLGTGFLRLARIREETVPISHAAQVVANWLADQTNETVHLSIPGTYGMTSVAHKLPNRGRIVNINPAELLYYHATASGLAFLSFATPETAARILALKREKIEAETITGKNELQQAMKAFRTQGYAQTRNSFEADVASVAMPFFRGPGDPAGSISIASPKSDLTEARRDTLLPLLREGVQRVELALTGL